MDDKIKLKKLEIKDGVYVEYGPGGGVPGGCQSISGGSGGVATTDLSMSTVGRIGPFFGGEGEGQGSCINYTIDYRPELAKFKQEILNRLRALPRGPDYDGGGLEYGEIVEWEEIEKVINWIERGTD